MFFRTLAASAATLFVIPAAEADPAPATRSVHFDAADLADEARRAELDERMRRAARRACSRQGWGDVRNASAERRCINTAMADAQAQLDAAARRFAERDASAQAPNRLID